EGPLAVGEREAFRPEGPGIEIRLRVFDRQRLHPSPFSSASALAFFGAAAGLRRASAPPLLQYPPMSTQPVPFPQAVAEADILVSVLVPVLDEAERVLPLAEQVAAVLDRLGRSFEIIFVDDGSQDGTAARVREAHERDPRVKLLRLRRNFGKA